MTEGIVSAIERHSTSVPVSVVISTRNRGASVCGAVQSILLNDYPSFEVIVVDQSSDHLTRSALTPLLTGSPLRYVKVDTQGVSAGRNEGISEAQGEVILITDDDCEMPPVLLLMSSALSLS